MNRRFPYWLLLLVALVTVPARAENNPFLGKWNMTGQGPHANYVYWLEVKEEAGDITALFLNRGGSPVPVEDLKIEGEELAFKLRGRADRPGPQVRLKAAGETVSGTVMLGDQSVSVAGVRPPQWGHYNASAPHTFGQPVELFSGKSLDAWTVQHKDRPMGWKVEDGLMTNEPRGNNLVSREKFQDFKILAEYMLEEGSNSGIYLRGRYELQILDDFGREPDSHNHMAIYARKPADVNASKRAGEWQSLEATIVGNRVTVILNGMKVHDNAAIEGITGGALDANELQPGPIMIQGDHGKVWFRQVTVIPIPNGRKDG